MVTANSINSQYPIEVASGGTTDSSLTAYGVICGGTTASGALQSISTGTSGQVLTSNGSSSLPSFQTVSGGGSLVLVESHTASGAADVQFTTGLTSTYVNYKMFASNVLPSTNSVTIVAEVSTDGGSTWKTTGYYCYAWLYNASTQVQTSSTSYCLLSHPGQAANTAGTAGAFKIDIWNIGTTTDSMIGGYFIHPYPTGIPYSHGMVSCSAPFSLTINAIRIRATSGNISGNFSLFGEALS